MVAINRKKFVFIFSILFLFSFSYFPSCSYANTSPNKLYQSAKENFYSLKSSEKKQSIKSNWNKCIKKFLSVYQQFPNSNLAGDALFTAGSLYHDSYKRFRQRLDLDFAIKYYKIVVENHSKSRLADDALSRIGEIQFSYLKQYSKAHNSYTRVIREFPNGDMYNPALKKISALSAFFKPVSPKREKLTKVTEIRHFSSPEATRIVIELENKIQFKEQRLKNPERIYVDLFNASIDKNLKENPIEINNGFIKKIRASHNNINIVRVVIDINKFNGFKVSSLNNPFRIILDIEGKPLNKTILGTAPNISDSNVTIVIDPGHGGKDQGARGVNNLKEKDVVLDISLKLKKIIEKKLGYKVILTRNKDIFIKLKKRTAIANKNEADIFISIHANASRHKSASGIETYYLDFAKSNQALETAARENKTPLSEIRDDVQYILADLVANTKMNESSQLAGIIQSNLIKGIRKNYQNVKNLRAKGGPFYVLYGANMPSILVETSFISNPMEGKRLRSVRYRERIAHYILDGIEKYLKEIRVAL